MADDAEPTEAINPTLIDDLAVARERATEARRWLKSLCEVLSMCDHDSSRNSEAQAALDSTLIAVCARIRRLVRSDLGPGDSS